MMPYQEILVFMLVVMAGLYCGKKFIDQFTKTEAAGKCGKCELMKAVEKPDK